MRQMRDFVCSHCGYSVEKYVDDDYNAIECPECQGTAHRVISMPRVNLDGTDSGFPGAYDRWARIREENARIRAKRA
jgi:putative FmdB family regulatory protein